ncbi:MAG: hypothetical protein EPGJADBJ_04804 [Saprospiraceae bacterium]|nr:hypothetical protein [Saprospiraceae bacterium]
MSHPGFSAMTHVVSKPLTLNDSCLVFIWIPYEKSIHSFAFHTLITFPKQIFLMSLSEYPLLNNSETKTG